MTDRVITTCAAAFGVEPTTLRRGVYSMNRKRDVSHARALAMYVLYGDGVPLSYPDVGRLFGCGHTTVVMACQRVRRAIECGDSWISGEMLAATLARVQAQIGAQPTAEAVA